VLYNFIQQKIQHPAELRGTFGSLFGTAQRTSFFAKTLKIEKQIPSGGGNECG